MSRYTTARWGSVEILTGSLNMNRLPIVNVRTPESPTDVVTKGYVDAQLSSIGGANGSGSISNAGEGLTLTDGTFTVNPVLTHIKQFESSSGSFGTLNVSEKLTVPVDPATPAEAASKQYVDLVAQSYATKEYVDNKIIADKETTIDAKLANFVSKADLETNVDAKIAELVSKTDLEKKDDKI